MPEGEGDPGQDAALTDAQGYGGPLPKPISGSPDEQRRELLLCLGAQPLASKVA